VNLTHLAWPSAHVAVSATMGALSAELVRAEATGASSGPLGQGFRHGLRVSELFSLQWSSIEFEAGTIYVRRAKGGQEATHPLFGDELRALRELKRQSASPFVFASERGSPFTPSGFAKLLARTGEEAEIGFKVHPHMLRHACGYALANKGLDTRTLQAYLGHRSINSTTRYAALAPGRFKNI
jgi:integrase